MADVSSTRDPLCAVMHCVRIIFNVPVTCRNTSTHLLFIQIKDLGVKAGVVLNPATPLETIQHVLTQVDLILLMSGEPLSQHTLRYTVAAVYGPL